MRTEGGGEVEGGELNWELQLMARKGIYISAAPPAPAPGYRFRGGKLRNNLASIPGTLVHSSLCNPFSMYLQFCNLHWERFRGTFHV